MKKVKMDAGTQTKVKMSGYLYKKCKKRMISSWKTYWFVLEDRLLLYYRSKDEYQAISPCKGSINLGPPCVIKSFPSATNAFQIQTRTNTFTLRAEKSEEQIKWMQTIMSALNQNQNFTSESPKRLNHFRYSLDDLIPEREPNDCKVLNKIALERQNTMPDRLKETQESSKEIIQRLQKIGAHSYGGSLGAISKIATKKSMSPNLSLDNSTSKSSIPESDENIVPVLRPLKVGDNLYERISGDSNSSQASNRNSFIVDNENYSIPVRKADKFRKSNSNKETNSFLVENDQYVLTRNLSEEVVYSEPKVNSLDHNKNSVLVENTYYTPSSSKSNENVYEDLDKFIYNEPVLKNEESSSHSSQECKTKTKKKEEKNKSVKKSKSFIKRVWKKRSKKLERQERQEEEIYEEVDVKAVEKIEYNNENAMQMLSELQNILEHKKTILKATVSNASSKSQETTEEEKPKSSASDSETCPSLPPKTHKPPTRPDRVPSLDEILEDLNREKESKSKVQKLIERFSEPESDDVILRKYDRTESPRSRRSDDLNKLLDELSKVTSAPILTPGVTSSLVNPPMPDDEWMKLLPARQRRMSEPDYDVPRPHKSIQLPAKSENVDAIPATRFLGPVLPPTITDNSSPNEDSFYPCMTPDSLEVEEQKSPIHCSYTSHNYFQIKNDDRSVKDVKFSHDYSKEDDKIIYAMPKSYLSVATEIVNTCQNICSAQLADECTIIYKNVKNVDLNEEIFSDSLELCNQ